eukprot:EG_transcript_12483
MIIFYGFELVTGNMLILTLALLARRVPWLGSLKNIIVVYIANFLGAVLYVAIFYGCFTYFGLIPGTDVKSGPTVISIGRAKTVDYYNRGGLGWAACFMKAIMCNFLVGFGMMGSMVSTSTTGKVVACWFPVAMFAILGYEHVVINMYAVSCSMTLGSGVSQGQWWGWSLAPSTLGNLVGAWLVAFPMWITQGHEYRAKQREQNKPEEDKLTGNSGSDVEVAVAADGRDDPFGGDEDLEEGLCEQSSNDDAVPNTPIACHY